MLGRISDRTDPWDMLVIGGGATGVGIAVDAASRGYDVLLLEQSDFGKGTSSEVQSSFTGEYVTSSKETSLWSWRR